MVTINKRRLRFLIGVLWVLAYQMVEAQTKSSTEKVQLEDVDIKGEVNKDNMAFRNRNKMTLDDRIMVRKQFRDRILENLPSYYAIDEAPAKK